MNEGIVCEAMIIEDDKFVCIGSNEEILSIAEEWEKTDLKGQTVLPAFIDCHSHILAVANSFLQTDLWGIAEEDDIAKRIVNRKRGIVKCFNLSNEVILDSGFMDQFDFPLVIQHNSGHSGFFNKKAQKLAGINSCFVQENEYFEAIKKLPVPDIEEIEEAFKEAEKLYMSKGISLVQEGQFLNEMLPIYKELIKRNAIDVDIAAYYDIETKEFLKGDSVKKGGYKIFLDGSPQAKTAWVSKPYENTDDCGISTMTYEDVDCAVKRAVRDNMQIIAHCNGDMAVERFIKAVENNREVCRLRPVIIHGQLMRRDQINRLKDLNIIPSFFIAHVYYYGDVHLKNLGERAKYISPLKSAVKAGVYPTIHQDSPVVMPDMFESIWCGVKRESKGGVILGEDERISVYEALETVTVNAARQYFMEDERGSIEVGKRADFIVTDKNPFKVSVDELRYINVKELYRGGKPVWSRRCLN